MYKVLIMTIAILTFSMSCVNAMDPSGKFTLSVSHSPVRPAMTQRYFDTLYSKGIDHVHAREFDQAERIFKYIIQNNPYRLDVTPESMSQPINMAALNQVAFTYQSLIDTYLQQNKYSELKPYLLVLIHQKYNIPARDQAIKTYTMLTKRAQKYEAALGLMNLENEAIVPQEEQQ